MLLHFIFGRIFVTELSSIVMDVTSREENSDYYTFLGNCPTTPPLSQHFGLSKK